MANSARENLRRLQFELGTMTGKVKQAKSEAIKEAAQRYAERIAQMTEHETWQIQLYLNDFAQEVKDIMEGSM